MTDPMRLRAGVTLVLIVAALAAGCGGVDEEESQSGAECGPAASAIAGSPDLPAGFPRPEGVTYTKSSSEGSSTFVEGYRGDNLKSTYEAYQDSFEQAGYNVVVFLTVPGRADVEFAGANTDGSVRISDCGDHTWIKIVVSPCAACDGSGSPGSSPPSSSSAQTPRSSSWA